MAQVHGNVANYPAHKRRELLLRMLVVVLLVEALAGFVVGLSIGSYLPGMAAWVRLSMLCGGAAAVVVVFILAVRWMNRNEQALFAYIKGADGESVVADELRRLPSTFHVLHGVDTANGDVDHLVIGPTGVFALDAKKWSGHFTVDAQGRLLRNGVRMDEDHAAKLQRRIMVLRDMLITPGGPDPYFQGALVLVGSSLQISQGALGKIDAMTPDQLVPYLTRTQGRRELSAAHVQTLMARALSHSPAR